MNAVVLLALLCLPARAQVNRAVEPVDVLAARIPVVPSLAGDAAGLTAKPLSAEVFPLLVALHPGVMSPEPATRRQVEVQVLEIHPEAAVSPGFAGIHRSHLLVLAPGAQAAERIHAALTGAAHDVARLDGMLNAAGRAFLPDGHSADAGRVLFDRFKPDHDFNFSAIPALDEAGIDARLNGLEQSHALENHARTTGLLIARIRPTVVRRYSSASLRRASEALERGLDPFLAFVELMGSGAEQHPDVQAANRLIALGYAAFHQFRDDPQLREALWPRVESAVVSEAGRSDRFANRFLYRVHESLDDRRSSSPMVIAMVRSILRVVLKHTRDAWEEMFKPLMPSLASAEIAGSRVSLPTPGHAPYADVEAPRHQAGQVTSL